MSDVQTFLAVTAEQTRAIRDVVQSLFEEIAGKHLSKLTVIIDFTLQYGTFRNIGALSKPSGIICIQGQTRSISDL